MYDAFLALLRCPFDPARVAELSREGQSLVCGECHATFPIKNSIPVLSPDEAELPTGIDSHARLFRRHSSVRRPRAN